MSKEFVKYTVSFVGATPNQAQAIQGVIQSINDLKSKDELPIRKYEGELKVMYEDCSLFVDVVEEFNRKKFTPRLLPRVKERISYYQKEIATREKSIKNHKENIKYIDDYITKLRSYIKEEVNDTEKTVTYSYDMAYLTPFLDLAVIVFEMSFEEPSNNETKAN